MFEQAFKNIDELRFASQTEKHELSHPYEAKIKNMGNAGRNGGEYYTPRPLQRASRVPGQARSITPLIPSESLPALKRVQR